MLEETLFALPLEEEPPSEEVIDEAPEPEEEVVVPEPEPQPEPEVTPEEPEPQPEPEPEVTPEEPDPQPEPEEEVPPPPVDDCEETSELLYAVDKNNGGLYLFDPVGGSFELLGIPDCGMFSGTLLRWPSPGMVSHMSAIPARHCMQLMLRHSKL